MDIVHAYAQYWTHERRRVRTDRPTSTDANQVAMLDLHLYQDIDCIHRTLRAFQRYRMPEGRLAPASLSRGDDS